MIIGICAYCSEKQSSPFYTYPIIKVLQRGWLATFESILQIKRLAFLQNGFKEMDS